MTPTGTHGDTPSVAGTVRRVRFVTEAGAGDEVLAEFVDPAPRRAVCRAPGTAPEPGDGIDVLTAPGSAGDDPMLSAGPAQWVADGSSATPTVVTVHGAQVVWTPARAAILAPADRTEPFLRALVEFCYFEAQLRALEAETAAAWPLLDADSALSRTVTTHDPDRFEDVTARAAQALDRRVRLARIVPYLYQPRPHLPPLANQLIDRLRERAHIENRHEALAAQLDVFDRVYEMTSQLISDFTASRQQKTLEWVIIVLLAAETLLLLIDLLWTLGV